MGFDFIMIVPLLLSHYGFFFVFGCRVFFGRFQWGFFVVDDGYSAVSCDLGVFIRRGEFVFLLCHLADQLLPFLSIQAPY